MYSAEDLKSNQFGIREEYDNIIKQTKNIAKHLSQEGKFLKAKSHIIDALKNKQPRPVSYSPELSRLYHVFYFIQSWMLWDWLIFLLSYTYMYLVIVDSEAFAFKLAMQGSILAVFFFDLFIDFYCRSCDQLKQRNRYFDVYLKVAYLLFVRYPNFYFWKLGLLLLMLIDLIIFASLPCYDSRPIRPLRILRAFIPVFFDSEIRKSLLALASAYKTIFAFIIYYLLIVFGFAMVGSLSLTFDRNFVDPSYPQVSDAYSSNYDNLGKMIFQIYGLATYDYYPQNQLLAAQNYEPNYFFFIVFVFFNMFLFTSVPAGLIYSKFRDTRSKYIIVDQIKQQHSLILAFVTLALDQHNLPMHTLIKFLFFFYRNKIRYFLTNIGTFYSTKVFLLLNRYVQYITDICLKLDDNNNSTIQVNQFMQFSKILLYNSIMYPPAFDDIQLWLSFRKKVNQTIHLKAIVKHWLFEIILAVVIVLGAINSVFLMYNPDSTLLYIFDSVFVWVYFAELLVRIVGVGPQKFFADRWNNLDALMIFLSVVFFFAKTNSRFDELIRMFRFFRLIKVFIIFIDNPFIARKKIVILQKLKRLFSTFLQIMPIIIRFFHVFAFFFFIFGIIGLELFYSPQYTRVTDTSAYKDFIKLSNFNSFIHSQYVMMQTLTEGGWTYIAWNYAWRNPHFYGFIVAYFMLMHLMIVSVVGMLLKGIFWEIYATVSDMMDEIENKIEGQQAKDEENEGKTRQINQIMEQIQKQESISPDTLLKRELIEKKLDNDILRRVKDFIQQESQQAINQSNRSINRSNRSANRSKIVQKIMENWNINKNDLRRTKRKPTIIGAPKLKKRKAMEFNQIELKQQQDFQQEMQELLNDLIINSRLSYSQIVAYPRIFVDFLNSKFKNPNSLIIPQQRFDVAQQPLYTHQSMNLHVYQMNNMLGNDSSKRQRKNMIVQCLLASSQIDEATAQEITNKTHVIGKFHVDTKGALRKMYLSETNQGLVKKFQIEYFSDVYGYSFRKINKITLEPLLKLESSLTYSLWNLLRYPQIDTSDFFHLLTHIQDQMSNKLLTMGSLVKFIYKVDNDRDIWFVVDLKRNQEMQIRFIKTGLWIYTHEMQPDTPYYARDIFNLNPSLFNQDQRTIGQQYLQKFYQNFQTIAFSLLDKKNFFESNPSEYIHDLYVQTYEAQRKGRQSSFGQLKISNVMFMVLAKEVERADIGQGPLPYSLSDLKSVPRERKKQDFLFNQQNNQTYEQLKNLGARDHQRIIESQGLPFAYIVNMMKQISDILKLYNQNLVAQVEKALNEQYIKLTENDSANSDAISMPQVRVVLTQQAELI